MPESGYKKWHLGHLFDLSAKIDYHISTDDDLPELSETKIRDKIHIDFLFHIFSKTTVIVKQWFLVYF